MTTDATLQALADFSAAIGANAALVQGAGGNTSAKQHDLLWVKASGTWLQDATRRPVFVPVSLSHMRRLLTAGDLCDADLKQIEALDDSGLAPSIETPLHALMPQPVVAHVHAVRTIAWGARRDGRTGLEQRLAGLNWAWVPYVRPGAPLANVVGEVLAQRAGADILVLANHGLVVGADDCADAERLIDDVERRLVTATAAPAPRQQPLPTIAAPSGFRWSDDPWLQALVQDNDALALAAAGSLYPDHVVFLGPRATVVDDVDQMAGIEDCKMILVRGCGVLLREDLSPGALSMAHCLGRVVRELRDQGVQSPADIDYLSVDDEAQLMGWDAEAYRSKLDQLRAQSPGASR